MDSLRPGQNVYWFAHIRNYGTADAPPVPIEWRVDGKTVLGVSKVSALKRTTEVTEHREGGDPSTSRKSPGRTKFDAVTISRGITFDTEFVKWANKVWNLFNGRVFPAKATAE